MPVLHLTESEVRSLLDMPSVLDAVEEAFRQLAAGEAHNIPRQRARAPGVILHTMSAGAGFLGLVGWKCYTTTAAGARFHVALYNQKTGRMTAWIEADHLGRMRTGAATGVAAQWMAAPEATEMGLIGTGRQAEWQLAALAVVRNLTKAFVYGRDAARRQEFCERMSTALNLELIPVDRPQDAVEDLPIVVTATTAHDPVFDGHWLAEGSFVAAVGSNSLNRAELDATAVRRADTVVCDSVECCRREAGDFVDALERGVFNWSQAADLANVVAGRASPRHGPAGIGLFKSVGMAIEDVAVGALLMKRAAERGIGTPLPID